MAGADVSRNSRAPYDTRREDFRAIRINVEQIFVWVVTGNLARRSNDNLFGVCDEITASPPAEERTLDDIKLTVTRVKKLYYQRYPVQGSTAGLERDPNNWCI